MPIFKYEAEHISRRTALKLVREFEDHGVEVEYANMDPTFDNCMIMIATVENSLAGSIRARIWEENGGASCDMSEITEDTLNTYL
jgi:hypothetical protein